MRSANGLLAMTILLCDKLLGNPETKKVRPKMANEKEGLKVKYDVPNNEFYESIKDVPLSKNMWGDNKVLVSPEFVSAAKELLKVSIAMDAEGPMSAKDGSTAANFRKCVKRATAAFEGGGENEK